MCGHRTSWITVLDCGEEHQAHYRLQAAAWPLKSVGFALFRLQSLLFQGWLILPRDDGGIKGEFPMKRPVLIALAAVLFSAATANAADIKLRFGTINAKTTRAFTEQLVPLKKA